nr:retrovirus-related Pol polyprotein from transposon TNT 1-94 [Tanacetum cinerariifolium]
LISIFGAYFTSLCLLSSAWNFLRGTGYDNQRIGNVAGAKETLGTTLRDDTDESEDQELEAHYMYMAQIQEVTPDAADNFGPIFDSKPLQKVSNDDNYNVFAIESEHPEQSEFVNDTYLIEQDEHNVIIDSLDGNDLLTGSRGIDLYSITLQDTSSPNQIYLMAKATSSQAWFWHRRLSHLNFDIINLLSKNDIVIGLPKLNFIKDHLCSSCPKTKHLKFSLISLGLSKEDFMLKDGENLDKMKEKGDAFIFVGYSTQSRAYRVFNKRTRVIVESIHVNFDELPQMASDHVSSDPVPQSGTVTTSNELDLIFSLMFDELFNGSTPVVSKSSTETTADVPNQC